MTTVAVKRKKKRRWVRRAVLGLLVAAAVAVAVPFVFTNAIVRMVLARTPYGQFDPTFATARLSVWGGLTVKDFVLHDEKGVMLQADTVLVRFSWADLLTPRLASVEVEGMVAYERPGEHVPMNLIRLGNPNAGKPAAPAVVGAKPNRFRLDYLQVSGRVELTAVAGVTLPSQKWGIEATLATTGPEDKAVMSVEAKLTAMPVGEQEGAPMTVDFHLQNTAQALSMSAEVYNASGVIAGSILQDRTSAATGGDHGLGLSAGSLMAGDLTVEVEALRGGITLPQDGGKRLFWYDLRGVSVTDSNVTGAAVKVTGLVAGGDGELHAEDKSWRDMEVNLRHLEMKELLFGREKVEGVAVAGGLRNGEVVLDGASVNVAGGQVRVSGNCDLATMGMRDVKVNLVDVQATQAEAYLPPGVMAKVKNAGWSGPLEVDGRITAEITAKEIVAGKEGVSVSGGGAKGRVALVPLEGLVLPSEVWSFDANIEKSVEKEAKQTVTATMVALDGGGGPMKDGAILKVGLQQDAAGTTINAGTWNSTATVSEGFVRHVAPGLKVVPAGLSGSVGEATGSFFLPVDGEKGPGAAKVVFDLKDVSLKTPGMEGVAQIAGMPVEISHLSAAGSGTIVRRREVVEGKQANVLDWVDSGASLTGFKLATASLGKWEVENVAISGAYQDGKGPMSVGFNMAGGGVSLAGEYDTKAMSLSNAQIGLTNMALGKVGGEFSLPALPVDGTVSVTLSAQKAALADVAKGWKGGVKVDGVKVDGSMALVPMEGLTLPEQSWAFVVTGPEASDSKGANVVWPGNSAGMTGTCRVTVKGASGADGAASIDLTASSDAKAGKVDGTVANLSLTATADFIRQRLPTFHYLPDGGALTMGSLRGGITKTWGADTVFWWEGGDMSLSTPVASANPMDLAHVVCGGNALIPAGTAGWQDWTLNIEHFSMASGLIEKQSFEKLELAASLKQNVAYLQWMDVDYAQGRVSGYFQWDLLKSLPTEAGLKLSNVEMHDVLGKLAPTYIDANGRYDGDVLLKAGDAGPTGTVTLTAKGPGILRVHDAPGIREGLESASGNKYVNATLAELSEYHYTSGNVAVTSSGLDTGILLNFQRDMEPPGVPLAGGIEVKDVGVAEANAKVRAVDHFQLNIHGTSLQDIINQLAPDELAKLIAQFRGAIGNKQER